MTDFTIAAEKTVNGVVHVKNTSIQKNDIPWWYRNFYGDDEDEMNKRIGTGSGVIISPDGLIITNYHVIEDATEIEITSNKNKTYKAEIIGSDPNTDLAVLKINPDENLPFIPFGDSDNSRIGEWVLAVGNPFNLNSTVTAGIISAKSRDLNDRDSKNQSFIQTDAAVNMGNSGGALVNTSGELIGINTAISSITGGFVGYSFAVPSNIVRKVFEDLIEFGNVQKGLLGVSGNALNTDIAEKFEILRDAQDNFALSSQKKAQKAIENDKFKDELVDVKINDTIINKDEHPRFDIKFQDLQKLKTAFKENGTVTPGNSSGINDGAAVLLLSTLEEAEKKSIEPFVKIVSWASVGVDPSLMGLGPISAVRSAVEKANWRIEEIDLFEINEAFAAQSIAVIKTLAIPEEKINVNGGAIALGHPLGCSGSRIKTFSSASITFFVSGLAMPSSDQYFQGIVFISASA